MDGVRGVDGVLVDGVVVDGAVVLLVGLTVSKGRIASNTRSVSPSIFFRSSSDA